MSQIKYFKFSVLFIGLALLPAQLWASAATEANKVNACKENGEQAAGSQAEDTATITTNNFNATGAAELGFRERGGQIGVVKKKMTDKLKKIKQTYANYESDPRARQAVDELEQCIEEAGSAESAAAKQAEDAKKANEEKGGGGGMPDLSSLLSALKKEPKQEEKKDLPLDCANPESSSNPVCMCQINPRASGCGSKEESESSVARKERTPKASSPLLGDSPTGASVANDRTPSKTGSSSLPGGAGGGGSGGMGSGSGSARSGNDNAYGAPLPKTPGVIDGTYGGGGGGSKSAGGGYRADSPLARNAARIQRSLASVGRSQTSKDGLTGPHTDLFRKVRTRYMSVRGSLNP